MSIEKQIAHKTIARLDGIAARVERLHAEGKILPKVAAELLHSIDSFADRMQIAADGEEAFRAFQAKVIQKDPDEKYMDTYDNPNKVVQSDPDEEYMHKTGPSFNSKGIDNYDQDRSITVTDRDEHAVRDLNEYAGGTKKQPSWSKGPAGKSTKQGSSLPANPTVVKVWAD